MKSPQLGERGVLDTYLVRDDPHADDTVSTGYLLGSLEPSIRPTVVRQTINVLRTFEFDAIVGCGLSGVIVGAIVTEVLNVPLIIVRKGEVTHGSLVEGGYSQSADRYVILDDFINTGATIRTILARIKEWRPAMRCVGIVLHNEWCDRALYEDVPCVRTANTASELKYASHQEVNYAANLS